MGKYREFDVLSIFSPFLLIVGGGELMTIDDPSLSDYGYHFLSLAISQLVSDHREFDVSSIF